MRYIKVFNDFVIQIVYGPGDKPVVHAFQGISPGKIVIAHVEHQNTVRGQFHFTGNLDFMYISMGEIGESR